MKTSVKFKDYKPIQKLGSLLIIAAAVITLAKFFNLLNASHFVEEDLPNYIFLVGGLLVLLPFLSRRIKGNNASNKTAIFLILFCTSFGGFAQDYSKQINAFAQSFADKNTEVLQPYISTQLQFKPVPVANTPGILTNIVTNMPKSNSMTIVESEQGKAKVAYDFEGMGKSESYIHFDNDGKIIRIQLIETIINQQIEAQRQQKVPLPTPGALGEKYISKKVEFKAPDGLTISGNLYEVDKNKSIILLMHQAGYNRMEYADIAPKLNKLGYNCLAVDLRSGGPFAEKPNNTNTHAIEKGLKPEMTDAQQDIAAAINFLQKKYNQNVIIWGSSFSSSLALLEGAENPKVKAIISFSPGDYFSDAAPSLSKVFARIEKPFLVTSSKAEAETLTALIGDSKFKKNQSQFIPKSNGFHGSRALWEGQEGAEEYWSVVTQFLNQLN